MDLVVVWAGLVALVMILYVVLDGISLGVGLLFPTALEGAERDTLMGSIAPVWDANQTWLVFGGGAIFASFPVVYGVLFQRPLHPSCGFPCRPDFQGCGLRVQGQRKNARPHGDKGFFLGESAGGLLPRV